MNNCFSRPQCEPHDDCAHREGVHQDQGEPQAQGERVDQGVLHPRAPWHEHQTLNSFC